MRDELGERLGERSLAASRFVWSFAIAAVIVLPTTVASATPASDAQAVAVNVQHTPAQSWPGYGIYLWDGLVITAAHVAGQSMITHPQIVLKGEILPTETVKQGSYPDDDLALLRILPPVPADLAQRHTQICTGPPVPDEAVIVAVPEKTTSSAVISPDILPPDLRGRYAASIKDVYTTGNSGSGVFDATSGCLLGIMSSKIEQHVRFIVNGTPTLRTVGLAKHFVPAADIQKFVKDIDHP